MEQQNRKIYEPGYYYTPEEWQNSEGFGLIPEDRNWLLLSEEERATSYRLRDDRLQEERAQRKRAAQAAPGMG